MNMGTFNNSKDQFTELLFENRNKNYGAYVMRKSYDRRVLISTGVTVSLFLLAIILPKLFGNHTQVFDPNSNKKQIITVVDLTPKEDKKKEVVEQKKVEPTTPPKGQKTALPVTPIDTNKVVKDDTSHYDPFAVRGDPKGKDSIPRIVFNPGTGTIIDSLPKKKEPVSVAEVNPEFPGGLKALYDFLKKNIKYPEIAKENELSGTVYMSFVVGEDGTISEVKNMNTVGYGLDKEAIRVVSMMPKWKPGMMGHETVPVRFNIPVKFVYQK